MQKLSNVGIAKDFSLGQKWMQKNSMLNIKHWHSYITNHLNYLKNTKNNGISKSWLHRILRSGFHTKYRHKSYFHSNQKSERLELVRWFSRKLWVPRKFLWLNNVMSIRALETSISKVLKKHPVLSSR